MDKYDKETPALYKNPWLYFVVTFAWTWAFWGAAILMGIGLESPFGMYLSKQGAFND